MKNKKEKIGKLLFTRMPVQSQLVILLVFTLLAVLNNFGWVFDLFSHFHIQYAVFALGYLLLFGVKKLKQGRVDDGKSDFLLWILVAGVVFAINLVMIIPVWNNLYQPKPVVPENGQKLTMLLSNVFVKSANTKGVVEMIKQYDADIVTLQEVWEHWPENLKQTDLKLAYPYQAFDPERGNLILSKLPILSSYLLTGKKNTEDLFARQRMSVLELTVQLPDGKTVELLNMHPPVPVFGFAPVTQRYMEFVNASASNYLNKNNTPLIVYGDFNSSVFSHYYQSLLRHSGLHSARDGFGLKPTWPSVFPPFWIGIDHVLLSHHFKVKEFKTGPFIGSDHLPVYVELVLE